MTDTTKSINAQFYDAVAELAVAQDRLALRAQALAVARKEETAAIIAVNEVQKKLDGLLDDLKKSAPRDTDWARRKLPKGEA